MEAKELSEEIVTKIQLYNDLVKKTVSVQCVLSHRLKQATRNVQSLHEEPLPTSAKTKIKEYVDKFTQFEKLGIILAQVKPLKQKKSFSCSDLRWFNDITSRFENNFRKFFPKESMGYNERRMAEEPGSQLQGDIKIKRRRYIDDVASDKSSEEVSFRKRKRRRKKTHLSSSESNDSESEKENKQVLTKKLIKKIKNKRAGALVDTGTIETLSVGDIDQFDDKRYRYITVKSKRLPKLNMRIKLDYPTKKNIPKDILVPGNKYEITSAKIFNLSQNSPSWITLRPGKVKVHKKAKGYLSYTEFSRKIKFSSTDDESEVDIKRKRRTKASSSSSSI